MAYDYDIIVIGGGPAGYAGAIRAAQLKKRVLCVEREHLGGICLNWGCIPTKALLTNAHLAERLSPSHAEELGFTGTASWDFSKIIQRSRGVAGQLNKGIAGLFRKYKVEHQLATAKVLDPHTVQAGDRKVTAESIVVATGARPRPLPGVEFDGKSIITYKEAMNLPKQPASMAIVGAGAIGMEFGYFYNALGTKVTVVEMLDRILPIEDDEISQALQKSLSARGMAIHTSTKTAKVEKTAQGVKLSLETPQGPKTVEVEVLLVAIGVTGNVEGVFADGVKVGIEKGAIQVNKKDYRTSVPSIYAVGDVIGPPALAHVATHEAINCIERIAGHNPPEIDYGNVPGCTYTEPGVGSVGLTEKAAKEKGLKLRIGRFPFSYSGRALAAAEPEGFAKLIFEAETGELLGAHLIGTQATEMIAELVLARRLEATEEEIIRTMHPHPTFSEAIMEAAAQGLGESVHI